MRQFLVLASFLLLTSASAPGWQLVPGKWEAGRGPDGNTVLIDAPDGLIVVDSGRHPAHQQAILAVARRQGKPITAIVNTHWHLDHTGGNAELRAAFPRAPIIGSAAIDGALKGFFPRSRAAAEAHIASGGAAPDQIEEIRRDMNAIDDLTNLRPSRLVERSSAMTIGGRRLDIYLERYAATAGDVWLYDPKARLAVVGDLVVGLTPFMDTACPEGWRRALGNIAQAPFITLIPGHGAPMDRSDFDAWRKAFDNLLDCAGSDRRREDCIDGWMGDASPFIPAADRVGVPAMVGYYIDTRLRASPAEKVRYCRGGPG